MLDQFADVGLHIARRNAPRLAGHQHRALAALRHCCPELPVQNFTVRLGEYPGVAHLVFVRAKDFPEVFNFLIHAIQHLPDCVDLHLAAFKPLERETNRQVLRQLHQHGLIRFGIRCLRGQGCKRLFQGVLRAAWQLRDLLLECACRCQTALPRADASEAR